MSKNLINQFSSKSALMLKYKVTHDQLYFDELMKDNDIKRLFKSIVRKKVLVCPTNMYGEDDLLSIAFIEMWRSIINYKFICPICGIKTMKYDAYKRHVKSRHGNWIDPKPTIDKHVLYNIGVYLQNAIRDEYNKGRKTNHYLNHINIFSPQDSSDEDNNNIADEIEFDNIESLFFVGNDMQNEVIFKSMVKEVIKDCDEITKEIFNAFITSNIKNCDIAKDLYERGVYASEQSAAVMVSRKVKQILNKMVEFYPELTNGKILS